MSITAVHCQNLGKSFAGQRIIHQLSFRVMAGQILALLGPSGCGKTTTLRLIAGFEQLDTGVIQIEDRVVADGYKHVPPENRRVGMVFQDYAIFPHLSVAQNIGFGLKRGQAAQARVVEMLAFVGLAGRGEQMPHELSGGQQQRVALARALAPNPAVLLLDEPFSNLDAALRHEVRQEVKGLLKQSRTTAVFVTHDQEEALFVGDEVAVIRQGELEQMGSPEVIFHQPRTRFVAEFVGQTDFVPGEVTAAGVVTPLGRLDQAISLPAGTAVEVAVRADDVQMVAADEGNGRVLDRQFVGIAYIYQVGLANGLIIHCWQPHTVHVSPGTAVQVTFRQDHPLSCFYQGQLAP